MTYPGLATTYNLARSSKDYREANTFLKDRGVKYTELSFPTIIARRSEGVIGIAANMQKSNFITLRTWIDIGEGNNIFVFIRLSSCYEGILRKIGIKKYWFWIYNSNKKMLNFCDQLDVYTRIKADISPNPIWFERAL
jgi:hypothetical protein